MNNKLMVKEVDFNGDTLMAAQDRNTDKIYVGVSWICNGIGFTKSQKDTQVQKIQSDLVLSQGCLKFQAGVFDGNNESLALELDFLPLWLAKISLTPKMQEDQPFIVKKLIDYQLKAKDKLAEAFIHNNQLSKELTFLQGVLDQMKTSELRLSSVENESKETKENVNKMKEHLTKVPDFKALQHAVVKYARQESISESEAWTKIYTLVGDQYGVNLNQIVSNRYKKINEERVAAGKKPYKESTLKTKYNKRMALEEKGLMQEAMNIIAGLN